MVSTSIFRLFLILSILVIVTGILLIVFLQIDRGYVFVGLDSDYDKEQQNLINHVYQQNQLQSQAAALERTAVKPQKTVMVVEAQPVEQSATLAPDTINPLPLSPRDVAAPRGDMSPLARAPHTGDVWKTPPQNDYYSQLLRHNPWSPYYQPGK